MTYKKHLGLLCAVIIIGLLIPPVMAVEAAAGEDIYRPFNGAQDRPDIDGDTIVWGDDRDGNWDIYLGIIEEFQGSHGYTGERITDNPASQEKPSISGNYIVWQDDRRGNRDIYLYDRSKRGEEPILITKDEVGDHWMPIVRGNYAAWYYSSNGETNIALYDIAAGETKIIDCDAYTKIPGGKTEFKPALSEMYVAWVEESDRLVHYYDIKAETIAGPVSTSMATQCWPSLHGSVIAWEDYRNGNADIYMTDLANPSGGEERITFDTREQVSPAIGGGIIVWEDTRDPGPDGKPGRGIYLYDLASGKEKSVRLPDENYDEHLYPAVSGNNIVWQRGASPNSNLYIFVYVPSAAVEPVLASITVMPSAAVLEIGETEEFAATALDQFGNDIAGIEVTWMSSDETVGTIDASGIFTAKAAGVATITATSGDVAGMATVTVSAGDPVLASIEVTPSAAVLEIGETEEFAATTLDQFGNEIAGIEVTWTSSDETVGTIDASGIFTAKAAGVATITAASGDVSGTATVTVSAWDPVLASITVMPSAAVLEIGETEEFAATALDQFGNEIAGIEVTWTSSDETVGTIDASGIFTAKAAGVATITAASGDVAGTATVTVSAGDPVLASITVTPSAAVLEVGETEEFAATTLDQFGNDIAGIEVTWTSSDETVGTIDASGIFTAKAAGVATITATSGDVSGTATVTVSAEESAFGMVVVSPSRANLEAGNSLKFDAIAFDPFGNIVPSDGVTWEVSDSDIGIINDCGVFTALRAGTVTVCAAGDGATGTSTVIVTCSEPIYARITVAPPAITLHTGGEETLIATVFDQYGGEMPGAEVTWESSDEAVGTIDADGRFIALAEGTTSITASVEGISKTAAITVTGTPPVLFDTVMISPPAITLDAGGARRFIAAAFDPEGSIVDDAVAIWSCNDETIGTIDADGLFMAGAAGKATLTASVEGISGSGTAEVTVRPVDPAAPARIAVNPPDFFIAAGQSLTLAARVFDQYGSEMPGAEVTWESSDPAIGTIGDCGHFAAKSDGEVILIASADEISGSACVTVEPSIAVPDCIEVEPSTATVAVGETREFTATVLDQCGNEMNWVRVIWSCSDAGIGTIDMAGLFTALTEGSADVVARAGGIEGTASVTVTAGTAVDPTPGNDGGGGHGWGDSGGDAGPAFSTGICEGLVYGETYTFSDIDVSPVSSVAVTAAETIPRLMVTVKGVACPTATEPPSGDVYEYIDICLYWVNPRCISSALVIFTVPVDWIEDHGVLPEDIILMRCVDGTWQPLQTGFVGEESGSYCFRAITPGFSTFAIAAAAPESEAATGEGESVTAGEEANITVSVTTVVTTETATLPATTTPATPLVYAPLLAPIFLFFWWRKRA